MKFQANSMQKIWIELLEFSLDGAANGRGESTVYERTNVLLTLQRPFKDISDPIRQLCVRHEWIYPDLHELRSIMLEKNSSPHYMYSYANRLFAYHKSIDQINSYVIPLLKTDPNSRRACITLIDPQRDEFENTQFFPGITQIQFQIRAEALIVSATIRSCDAFLGLPANFFQLKCLGDYIAAELGISLGEISVFCANVHVYEKMLTEIKKYLK